MSRRDLRRLSDRAEIIRAIAIMLAASGAFVVWMTLDMSHSPTWISLTCGGTLILAGIVNLF